MKFVTRMMNSRTTIIALALAAIVVVAAAAVIWTNGHGNQGGSDDQTEGTVTDALGRTVKIPDSLENGIVTIGSTGPLRFASMFDVFEHVIEVDKGDITDSKNGRGYSYAFAYDSLDPSTQSHPDNALDSSTVESIVNKHPGLIITTEGVWNNYSANFGILAGQCTVVALKDQQMQYMTDEDGGLADYFEFNVNLLGQVLKKEDRAEELITGIEGILSDLRSVSGTSDKHVYVAGVTISGSNTLNTTFPVYIPFDLTGTTNAYDLGSTQNKVVLRVETFTTLDVDMIIVDPSSSDKVGEADSQYLLEYVYRLNNDSDPSNDIPIYVTVPIVWDSINYDCTLASAYYVSYLVYGNLTAEEVEEKIVHVFEVFYGEEHGSAVLDSMKEFFDGKSSANGQVMPLLKEVVVEYDSSTGKYRFAAA